jgi:GDP-L-fucose synthase
MEKSSKIFVAGHKGLVGSALVRKLKKEGFTNLLMKSSKELDLKDANAVHTFFKTEKPEYIFLAAAKVGGIVANNIYRGTFIYDNLMIQNNVIHNSYLEGVKKLLFLGSTCIYPKEAPQPMREDDLLTGPLEYTNEPYAIAKIAGIKTCESYNLQYGTNFLSVMPTNLYGPNDNFNLEKSHVLPALIRKLHLAKLLEQGKKEAVVQNLNVSSFEEAQNDLDLFGISAERVIIWGTGKPLREFLHVDDMADACLHVMQHYNFKDVRSNNTEVRNTHLNIGTGKDISIADLALMIQKIIGFSGTLFFDTGKPDGTMRKLTDSSRINKLGWTPKITLDEGVREVYQWYSNFCDIYRDA